MKRIIIPATGLCAHGPVISFVITIAILFVVSFAGSVNATTWECGERSNLPLEGKIYCAAGDFRQTEIDLRKVLDVLLDKHRLAYSDANALSQAQSAFEAYRDHQCLAENKRIEDKPYHLMLVSQCQSRLTNLRINELKRMQERDG